MENSETLPPGCRGVYSCLADYLERTAAESQFTAFRPAKPNERVYFVGGDDGPVKIGITTNSAQRLQHMQTGSPVELKVLAVVPAGRSLERAYHSYFERHRIRGEWFERSDQLAEEIRHWSRKVRRHA